MAVVLLLFGRGKISELMGDVAQGIKAFKKGMTEDETAKAEPAKTEPVKTIDHQAAVRASRRSSRRPSRARSAERRGGGAAADKTKRARTRALERFRFPADREALEFRAPRS